VVEVLVLGEPAKQERFQTNMDGTLRMFGGSARMQGTFFGWKTGPLRSWSGAEKIRFLVDDSEVEVKEKLTSDILDDNEEPKGFSQLKEAKGFEILSCAS